MGEIKWIKLTTDMFDNRKIKHIRKLPDGNSIVLIWVMLLTLAGRCNAGGMIFLTEDIPYTTKMLADELEFEENTVVLAISALEQLGMVITDNGYIAIAGWEEYQNIDGMEKIKEQTRARVAKYRENHREICNVTSNVTVTQSNATDIDIDIDIEIYKYIVELLNEKAGTNYRYQTEKTKNLIKARLKEGFKKEDFETVIDKKVAEWKGTDMEKFLRPETLFGTKFESYLNQTITKVYTGKYAEVEHRNEDLDKSVLTKLKGIL